LKKVILVFSNNYNGKDLDLVTCSKDNYFFFFVKMKHSKEWWIISIILLGSYRWLLVKYRV